MGELLPITWYEAIPGDTIQQRSQVLMRLSPLLAPIMHPVVVRIHHWFVPYRLIWEDWEDFITGGSDGNDTTTYPYLSSAAVTEGTIPDYMGVPPDAAYSPSLTYSALPFRAYNLIFNEHYRDQDLVSEVAISTGNGADATTAITKHKVSWEKDYFTAARPWEQKGTEITIPLSGEAPITGLGVEDQNFATASQAVYETDGTNPTYANAKNVSNEGTAGTRMYAEGTAATGGYPNIYADLSAATGVSVNDLRLYLAMQRYKEARAEFGSRYVEYLQAAFGVRSSDARLQNPEYLGGGRQLISFSEILSTADSGTDVVGQMRGHGITAMRTNRYRRFFEEHGIVMSLMSVVPKAIYANGLHRSFRKTDKTDYYQKELAFVGDQTLYNREVYTSHTNPDNTFGYQNRYDEYRYHPSGIAGEFRSTLNHWHYARLFSSDVSLNSSFIECNPTKRQYADNASDVLYVMANHSIQARRMIPKYPTKKIV